MEDILMKGLGLGTPTREGEQEFYDVSREVFADVCTRAVAEQGARLALMYATDDRKSEKQYHVHAVLAVPHAEDYLTVRIAVPENDARYPSVTAHVVAAQWYERLIGDQFGIEATGHPDWRRLVHHENIPAGTHHMRKDFAVNTKLEHANEPYPMHAVAGDGVYEIPVGPIHAGIIEPGHFRFNVMGERIITLEGKLFFKHRGIEKLAEGKTPHEALAYAERASGDMTVAHALAFCKAVESAGGVNVPARALAIRTLLLELERITMHVHDIANIGGNGTGLTFFFAQGSRMVERLRRMHSKLFGNRFLRGVVSVGGVTRDVPAEGVKDILLELKSVIKELQTLEGIGRNTDSFMERLETTGVLKRDAALAYGAVGIPARASLLLNQTGDVAARFWMRFTEARESIRLCVELLKDMPDGSLTAPVASKEGSALGVVESWRGELIDWVRLNKEGNIDRLVIRDPSFCNWPLFGELAPGNIVPDFPICNKSLNLSYAGNDL